MAKKKRSNNKSASPDAIDSQSRSAPDMTPGGDGPATRSSTVSGKPDKTTGAERKSSLHGLAALPGEIVKGDWTIILLALMMFFTPTLGVPHEEMLQDTLKSIVVSFFALGAVMLLMWKQRNRRDALRWHVLMWFPVLVCLHALSAIFWAHNSYLPGVEACRWFVFAILLWLGLNTMTRERFDTLAIGIHVGAIGASLWGLLQYWIDLKYFPQGPNPASTFVNRNFGAEFIVTTLPYTVYLLLRARSSVSITLMAFTLAFNLTYIMACGTRAALISLSLMVVPLVIGLAIFRSELQLPRWSSGHRVAAAGVFLCAFVGMGLIQSGSSASDLRGTNAFQRTFSRAESLAGAATEESFGMRKTMWAATGRMIMARPVSGVGGGVWEVDQPLYQTEGSQLETDYYVHNEFLQHIAEYGLIGWLTIGGAVLYLAWSAWRTLRDRNSPGGQSEGLIRMIAMCSLFALFVVSNAGFPWRMASTCALFALGLAVIAATDARLGYRGLIIGAQRMAWKPVYSQVLIVFFGLCTVIALYITQKAAECESKIVRATKLALGITGSGDPNNPKYDKTKREMLALLKEGTDINPHYRKITPMVADELAKWGNWKDAIWIWESVLSSRPYVVAIMSNAARGYVATANYEKAQYWIDRMKALQPRAVSARSIEVILLDHQGKRTEAAKLARQYLDEKTVDADLALNAYVIGNAVGDYKLALEGLDWRSKIVPPERSINGIRAAQLFLNSRQEDKAIEQYRMAVQAASPEAKAQIRAMVPPQYQSRL